MKRQKVHNFYSQDIQQLLNPSDLLIATINSRFLEKDQLLTNLLFVLML